MPIEKLNPLRYLGPAEYTGFWQQLFATLLYGFWGRFLFVALVVSAFEYGSKRIAAESATSGIAEVSEHATARPQAIASSTGNPKPS